MKASPSTFGLSMTETKGAPEVVSGGPSSERGPEGGESNNFGSRQSGLVSEQSGGSRQWGWFDDSQLNLAEEDSGDDFSASSSLSIESLSGPSSCSVQDSADFCSPHELSEASSAFTMGSATRAAPLSLSSSNTPTINNTHETFSRPSKRTMRSTTVTAPNYVLEESLSSQKLWKLTAQQRPVQPAEERDYFEDAWIENFKKSKVMYDLPPSRLFKKNLEQQADDSLAFIGSPATGRSSSKYKGLKGRDNIGVKDVGELSKELDILQDSLQKAGGDDEAEVKREQRQVAARCVCA